MMSNWRPPNASSNLVQNVPAPPHSLAGITQNVPAPPHSLEGITPNVPGPQHSLGGITQMPPNNPANCNYPNQQNQVLLDGSVISQHQQQQGHPIPTIQSYKTPRCPVPPQIPYQRPPFVPQPGMFNYHTPPGLPPASAQHPIAPTRFSIPYPPPPHQQGFQVPGGPVPPSYHMHWPPPSGFGFYPPDMVNHYAMSQQWYRPMQIQNKQSMVTSYAMHGVQFDNPVPTSQTVAQFSKPGGVSGAARGHRSELDTSRDYTSCKSRHSRSRSPSGERFRSRDRSRSSRSSRRQSRSRSRSSSRMSRTSHYRERHSVLRRTRSRDRQRSSSSPPRRRQSKERRKIKEDPDRVATVEPRRFPGETTSRSASPKVTKVSTEDVPEGVADHELEQELEEETSMWTRSSPADLHYQRGTANPALMVATPRLVALHDQFDSDLVQRASKVRATKPAYEPPCRKQTLKSPEPKCSLSEETDSSSSNSSSDSDSVSSEGDSSDDEDNALQELENKKKHPDRLHEELWYNDAGEMNDGPLCRCSLKARRTGIRHGIYPGENYIPKCDPNSNNADQLFHYRITISPHTNFLTKSPTIIKHDGHEFIFEGFSMFSHYQLGKLPTCKVIRFNIEYTIHYIEERFPDNFTVRGLELFSEYMFKEILELVDLDLQAHGELDGCNRFHFMPRFARALEENGKEILSMNEVLLYLIHSSQLLVNDKGLDDLLKMNQYEWQNFTDEIKGMIVTYPGMKPCSIRVDQLDRDQANLENPSFPEIVHFGIRPLQLSYAGNPNYQKAWREYVKYRHLLANKPKVSYQDRHKLMQKEMRLQEMRTKSNLKRDVAVAVSSKGFYRTGMMCDIVQHAMLLPVLICHLRFHKSLDILEKTINHSFKDRYLLQLALTHPSYRENFGTNPDHARNSLTNCGIRQPEYGDRRIHYANTRKRGINTLINIMSRFGKREETMSNINHNERLEFLGDAVVEFLTSIHLYHLFPEIEEGGLATYRAAIVQNQHLAVLAKKLYLDTSMLYAHGSDLCRDLELRHAMANCFEALMGALFLDGGIDAAARVFAQTLFTERDLFEVWVNYPLHPIQEQEPDGDRQWIEAVPLLKKLTKFEDSIGVEFFHIRLLARAFTHRSVGYNNLTLGSNQRLEFLGDTVLQLVASEYLYKFFPEHHEGHLSLLRSSLVNNRTQSVVCDDLGMVDYAIYAYPKGELKTKDRADLLEAFLGALYVDQGLDHCRAFCQVCFFPRLQDFIMNQDWNDPKSKLQQCCLTLRTMDGGEPDIPIYRVIESKGPTNTRIFTVAVYFRGERLAKGSGHSIQQAEMAAASKALESSTDDLFPQLTHQKRVLERNIKLQQNDDNVDHPYDKRNAKQQQDKCKDDSGGKGSRDDEKDDR